MANNRKLVLCLAFLVVGLAAAFSIFSKFDPYVVTKRRVLLNDNLQQVQFVIDGYYFMPISVHGPFPSWSDSVLIKVRPQNLYEEIKAKNGSVTLIFPKDYDALIGDQVEGEIVFDNERRLVNLRATYSKSENYKSKLNGDYVLP
jgi:hypothetical protein